MQADSERCTVFLCRGCCCGSDQKHPDVDHAAQVARVQEHLGSCALIRVSDCLGACEHSNVVVVVPSREARQGGARPVWLGWVLDLDAADEIADWISAGGPGRAAVPDQLDLHRFRPGRTALRVS